MNAEQWAKTLTQQYGPFLKGKDLMTHLGFTSVGSFARARKKGLLEVPVFDLEGRRGPFAFTEHVAQWLASLSEKAAAKGAEVSAEEREEAL